MKQLVAAVGLVMGIACSREQVPQVQAPITQDHRDHVAWLEKQNEALEARVKLLVDSAVRPPPPAREPRPDVHLVVGGASQEYLWVLTEHKPLPELKRSDSKVLKPEMMSLSLYKISKNDKVQLVAARDMAYDIELSSFNQDAPTPQEIMRELGKQVK